MIAVKNSPTRGNSILDFLPEIERREIFSLGKLIETVADESIYDFGDSVRFLYFPMSSVFSTTSLMEDGSSAEVNLVGCEGVVGVFSAFNEQTARHWTNVLVGGEALKVETAAIRDLVGDSETLNVMLLAAYRNLMAQTSQRAVCNGRHSLAERFCFWLLMVHDCLKTDEIPLTHETIAKKIGARRAGITNVAGALQAAEIISYSRGTIKIENRAKLEKNSCECYHALQTFFDPEK